MASTAFLAHDSVTSGHSRLMTVYDSCGFRIDLHVHTRRYSPCAELMDPAMLGGAGCKARLHGLVITEHDVLWSSQDITELNRGLDCVRLFRGVEVSCAEGHVLVIGLGSMDGIEPGIPFNCLRAAVNRHEVALILAHSHLAGSWTQNCGDGTTLPTGFDAVEVASSVTVGRHEMHARALARSAGLGEVGGSDAHAVELVGAAFTAFPSMPRDEQELARMIRHHVGVPLRCPASCQIAGA